METQHFLSVCRRWWWVVIAGFLVTTAATVALTRTPTRQYQSTATFVIQPTALQEDDQVKALDALVQGGTVGETYASIARSRLVRDRAEGALADAKQYRRAAVTAEVVTGTRLIRLTVRAREPELAFRLARSLSRQTIDYVDSLGDSYRLDPLDRPTRPQHPLPTKRTVTLVLGGILGLMLGIGLAYVADYLRHLRAASRAASGASVTRPSKGELLWTPRAVAPVGVGGKYDTPEPEAEWMPSGNGVDQPA